MGKRGVMASTSGEAAKLSLSELDQQIAIAHWRVGAATKATLRNLANKKLRMLERVKAERIALQNS